VVGGGAWDIDRCAEGIGGDGLETRFFDALTESFALSEERVEVALD
jgi:hypothetical protein